MFKFLQVLITINKNYFQQKFWPTDLIGNLYGDANKGNFQTYPA